MINSVLLRYLIGLTAIAAIIIIHFTVPDSGSISIIIMVVVILIFIVMEIFRNKQKKNQPEHRS